MSEPDLKTPLREFKEYVALNHEPTSTIAARIGVAQRTIWVWLSDKSRPKAKSLTKLREFLVERHLSKLK
jgi:transcriptional regulator with XRE-family HTH domain